jgi:hypothetical protein
MTKLTQARFSMQCSYIAKNAAGWAGDLLTLPETYGDAVDAKTVSRFTDEMRGKLDRLDELAGRTTPPQRPELSDEAVEKAARGLSAGHYAGRFNLPETDPTVLMNVDANWHVYAREVRIVMAALAATATESSR